MKPLDGITVLDLTRLLPGAAATQILANFGAEVIKVEEPERGDYAREIESRLFALLNRGKKSVALNLKDPRGKNAFLRLTERADVVIEGFRPGVMQRLGLDSATLRSRNKRLIYVALTGYGQTGPYAQLAGHDVNYLALGGILDMTGPKGGAPVIPGVQIADLAGGALQAVIGVLLALAARHQTGRGQMVDVAMLDGVTALLPVSLAVYAATGRVPQRGNERLTGLYACYNIYEARDGRWVAAGALEPKFWATLCCGLGCERFIPDQFAEGARQAEMIAELAKIFKTRTAEEWFERFRTEDACVTPVRNVAELEPIGVTPRLEETPGQLPPGAAPGLGEHTREVLLWAGLPAPELDEIC